MIESMEGDQDDEMLVIRKGKRGGNWANLPLSRVSTIMRSSPEISSISPDAVVVVTNAAV